MRVAIIADIHANLEALEAALIAIEREGIDRIICTKGHCRLWSGSSRVSTACRK